MIIAAANKPPSKILRIGSPFWLKDDVKRRQSHTCSKHEARGLSERIASYKSEGLPPRHGDSPTPFRYVLL